MEAEQQTQENGEGTKGGGGSYICRQSSTRWTPTPEQIRILKDLYYNRGVRSPNGEQIQSISANLRQYGKIEGKNVFYWFQNHKARERQKKRFTSDHHHLHHQIARPAPAIPNPSSWTKPSAPNTNTYIYSNFASSGFFPASSSSASGIAVGQMGNGYGYGSVTMEKSFRECSISCGGSKTTQNNYGWVANNGIDPYYNTSASYSFFDHQKEQDEEDEEKAEEIETLPLFPTQREDIINRNGFSNNNTKYNNPPSCYSYTSPSPTSLELSLNSYTFQGPDS